MYVASITEIENLISISDHNNIQCDCSVWSTQPVIHTMYAVSLIPYHIISIWLFGMILLTCSILYTLLCLFYTWCSLQSSQCKFVTSNIYKYPSVNVSKHFSYTVSINIQACTSNVSCVVSYDSDTITCILFLLTLVQIISLCFDTTVI